MTVSSQDRRKTLLFFSEHSSIPASCRAYSNGCWNV